jgi:hypothetical protein
MRGWGGGVFRVFLRDCVIASDIPAEPDLPNDDGVCFRSKDVVSRKVVSASLLAYIRSGVVP